ncbi:MFS transporter [Hirschia maritima]|uniref:MFS transporter n=1 Tax=Hirschia maritima TaxID=1121961 RepID=UPI000369561F|nr:MFS transporter [Hirschia maritima]
MKISGLRWWVVGLVALATVINYIDRQTINVLWPNISKEMYPDVLNAQEFGVRFPDAHADIYSTDLAVVEQISDAEKKAEALDALPRVDLQALQASHPAIYQEIQSEKHYENENAAPDVRKQALATISVIFMFAYAFGQAIFGKIFDWVGTRIGFALSIGVWSIATAAHALANTVMGFGIFRTILGVAEAGNWPGATKANAEWFPTKERALAQGIFNSGAAIGGLISIPLIGFLAVYMSWQAIFILVGLIGLLWLLPWWFIVKAPPESHDWLTDSEREYILTGQKNQDVDQDGDRDEGYNPGTGEMLSKKQSWGVIIASAAIDPIWWLFIVWIPTYLSEVYNMDVKGIAIYGWVPYAGAMVGAWFGGLLAQNRLKAGWSVNAARKLTITIGCLVMLPALLAMANPGSPTVAVMIMAAILFGFQTAIGNVQTLASDFFGGKSVGTLAGFAGMAAKLAAAGLTFWIPQLTSGENYTPVFVIGAALALTALAAVWLLCGRIEPIRPNAKSS